jgi:hypothetical protein
MDGTYEEFDKRVMADYRRYVDDALREISNGMSAATSLNSGPTVRFFYRS